MSRGWAEMASGFKVGAVVTDRDGVVLHVEGIILSGEMVLADTGPIQSRVWDLVRKAAEAAMAKVKS